MWLLLFILYGLPVILCWILTYVAVKIEVTNSGLPSGINTWGDLMELFELLILALIPIANWGLFSMMVKDIFDFIMHKHRHKTLPWKKNK